VQTGRDGARDGKGGSAALVLDPYGRQHLLPQRVQVAHSDVLARFSRYEHDVIAVNDLWEDRASIN
jgi:hypothetical protein